MPKRDATPDSLVTQGRELRDRYAIRDIGIDACEKHYYETGVKRDAEDELYWVRVPDGQSAVDLVADMLSAQEVTINVPAASESQKDTKTADETERWLMSWLELNERNEDINIVHEAAQDVVMRGAVVMRVMLLPERIKKRKDEDKDDLALSGKFPLVLELRNWRNVYPVYERTRVSEIYECYLITVLDLRADFPDLDIPESWKNTDIVEMWEWWDEKRKAFWVAGKAYGGIGAPSMAKAGVVWLKQPEEHKLGCLPYSVRTLRGQSKFRGDPKRLAPSLLESWTGILDPLNKIESAIMTATMAYVNNAWVVYTQDGEFTLDLTANAKNYLRPDEKVEPIARSQVPLDVMQLQQTWSNRFEKASVPSALYGQEIGPNMAGYAIALLNESGRRIMIPIVQAIQSAMEDACANALRICSSYASDLAKGYRYSLALPYFSESEKRGRNVRRTIGLDYDALNDVYVEVKIGDPLPQDEERNIGMAQAMRQADASGKPLLSDKTIRERHLQVQDDRMEKKRILQEAFESQARDLMLQELAKDAGLGEDGQPNETEQIMQVVQELAQQVQALQQEHAALMKQPPQPPQQEGPPPLPPELMAGMMGGGGMPPGMPPGMEEMGMPPGMGSMEGMGGMDMEGMGMGGDLSAAFAPMPGDAELGMPGAENAPMPPEGLPPDMMR